MINLVLTRASYSVLIACDGSEALELSRNYSGHIHLLLSDVTMPKMDGVTLAGKLRQERPEMQALLISGKTSSEIVHGSSTFHFMRKPFRPAQLRDKIDELLADVSGDDPSSFGQISGVGQDSESA